MYFKKPYKGKGIVKILRKLLIELAKKKDIFIVRLEVNPIQDNALNLFLRFGFRKFGV